MADETPRRANEAASTERSPVDVLRTAAAAVVVLVLLLVSWLFETTAVTFLSQLFAGARTLPSWFVTLVVTATELLTTVAFLGGLVATVVTRQFRLLGTVATGAVVGALVFGFANLTLDDQQAQLLSVNQSLGAAGLDTYPTPQGLALVAAAATAAAPWLTRRLRRAAWVLVISQTLCHFFTAPVSLTSPVALACGWLGGSAALVLLGSPSRRPTQPAVEAGLAAVGIDLADLHPASVDARGSTPYFGTTVDGTRLFVKVLGSDERSADLLFRAYRRILPRKLGDERSFSTLRRAVEHEAFVAFAARDLGVPTPRIVAFAAVEPQGFALSYEGVAGESLDAVPPELVDDALLDAVWSRIALLRTRRIAHRDLRLANIFRTDDGEILLIDFGFSEVAASDLLLATDLAELLGSSSLVVGAERAVAAARRVLGDDTLPESLDRLRPYALSGATRAGMKEHPGLLDDLRTRVTAAARQSAPT